MMHLMLLLLEVDDLAVHGALPLGLGDVFVVVDVDEVEEPLEGVAAVLLLDVRG